MGSRRLMTLEMAMVDADPADLLATAAEQPHDPGFVPFVRRAQAAGIPIEVVSDGFGFFIEPALRALGVGELPVVTARTTFDGRRAADRLPERPPDVLRVRHVQAPAGARPSGGRPRGRLHRRRRERPLCRGLQRRRVREAVARADLRRGRLAVPALDASSARSMRGWPTPWPRGRPTRRRCRRPERAATGSSAAPRSGARASRTRRPTPGRRQVRRPNPSVRSRVASESST